MSCTIFNFLPICININGTNTPNIINAKIIFLNILLLLDTNLLINLNLDLDLDFLNKFKYTI